MAHRRQFVSASQDCHFPCESAVEEPTPLATRLRSIWRENYALLHGSVYFKAFDDAAAFAVYSVEREVFVVTASFRTYLLAP